MLYLTLVLYSYNLRREIHLDKNLICSYEVDQIIYYQIFNKIDNIMQWETRIMKDLDTEEKSNSLHEIKQNSNDKKSTEISITHMNHLQI